MSSAECRRQLHVLFGGTNSKVLHPKSDSDVPSEWVEAAMR